MNEQQALMLIKEQLNDYKAKKVDETSDVFVFMCEAPDPEMIPSKIAVAVNKKTSHLGTSMNSYDEAIAASRR